MENNTRSLIAEIRQANRRCPVLEKELELLSQAAIDEMARLLRDIRDDERRHAESKARRQGMTLR